MKVNPLDVGIAAVAVALAVFSPIRTNITSGEQEVVSETETLVPRFVPADTLPSRGLMGTVKVAAIVPEARMIAVVDELPADANVIPPTFEDQILKAGVWGRTYRERPYVSKTFVPDGLVAPLPGGLVANVVANRSR